MMFPHKITIYHLVQTGDSDVITRYVVSDVYCYGDVAVVAGSNGYNASNVLHVITSPVTAKGFGAEWTASPADRVVRGEGPNGITRFNQLTGAYAITSVENNDIGSCANVHIFAR